MESKYWYILAILIILGGSLLIYSPHKWHTGPYMEPSFVKIRNSSLGDYPYPLHVDGWNHLSQAKAIKEGEGIFHNPQLINSPREASLEVGFHIILAAISIITFTSLIKIVIFFPALMYLIGAFLLFLFFTEYLKQPIGGLIAIVLYPFIPSNANILGPWFATPSVTSIFFIGLYLCLFYLLKKDTLKHGLSILLIIVSFFTYPLIAFILAGHYLIYWLLRLKLNKRIIFGSLAVIFLSALVLLNKSLFVFEKGWTTIEHAYILPNFLHWSLLIVAIGGIIFLFMKKQEVIAWLLTLFSLFGIIMTFTYIYYDFTVFFPYQRLLFLWQILLFIPIGFGFGELINYLSKKNKILLPILLIIILGGIIALGLDGYYKSDEVLFSVQKIVDESDVHLINQIPSGSVILADPFIAVTIYPLSGNKVVSALNANLGGGDQSLYYNFAKGECYQKENLLNSLEVDAVLIPFSMDCTGFKFEERSSRYYWYSLY